MKTVTLFISVSMILRKKLQNPVDPEKGHAYIRLCKNNTRKTQAQYRYLQQLK